MKFPGWLAVYANDNVNQIKTKYILLLNNNEINQANSYLYFHVNVNNFITILNTGQLNEIINYLCFSATAKI